MDPGNKNIIPPPPLPSFTAGPGRDRSASTSQPCSCGTWYCCSRGIREYQEFVERFYWNSPNETYNESGKIRRTHDTFEALVSEQSVEVLSTDRDDVCAPLIGDENQSTSDISTEGGVIANFHDEQTEGVQNLVMESDDNSREFPPILENMLESSEDTFEIPLLDAEINHQTDLRDIATQDPPSNMLDAGVYSSPILEAPCPLPLMPLLTISSQPPVLVKACNINDQDQVMSNANGKVVEGKTDIVVRRHSRRSSTSVSVFHCSIASCRKKFYRNDALISHEKEHKLGDTHPFFCKVCNRRYANLTSYDSHMTRHRNCKGCRIQLNNAPISKSNSSNSNPLANYCDNCAENIRTKFSSSPAEKSDSAKSSDQDYVANQAEEENEGTEDVSGEDMGSLVGRSTFKAHCDLCRKGFKYTKWYEMHMLQHAAEKMKMRLWTCKYCENVFQTRYMLMGHIKVHPETKNFQCEECDAWFMKKHHLNHHMTVHYTSKEFACIICKKQFGSNCSLKTHQKKSIKCNLKLSRKLGKKTK